MSGEMYSAASLNSPTALESMALFHRLGRAYRAEAAFLHQCLYSLKPAALEITANPEFSTSPSQSFLWLLCCGDVDPCLLGSGSCNDATTLVSDHDVPLMSLKQTHTHTLNITQTFANILYLRRCKECLAKQRYTILSGLLNRHLQVAPSKAYGTCLHLSASRLPTAKLM